MRCLQRSAMSSGAARSPARAGRADPPRTVVGPAAGTGGRTRTAGRGRGSAGGCSWARCSSGARGRAPGRRARLRRSALAAAWGPRCAGPRPGRTTPPTRSWCSARRRRLVTATPRPRARPTGRGGRAGPGGRRAARPPPPWGRPWWG